MLKVLLVSHPSTWLGLTSMRWRAAVGTGQPVQLPVVVPLWHVGEMQEAFSFNLRCCRSLLLLSVLGWACACAPLCGQALWRATAIILPDAAYFPLPSFSMLDLFWFLSENKFLLICLRQLTLPSGLYCTSSLIVLPWANFWMFELLMAVGDDVWSRNKARVAKTSKSWG